MRTYRYTIDAPGRPEHGQHIDFTYGRPGQSDPPLLRGREPFQLRDGTLVHINYIGKVDQ